VIIGAERADLGGAGVDIQRDIGMGVGAAIVEGDGKVAQGRGVGYELGVGGVGGEGD